MRCENRGPQYFPTSPPYPTRICIANNKKTRNFMFRSLPLPAHSCRSFSIFFISSWPRLSISLQDTIVYPSCSRCPSPYISGMLRPLPWPHSPEDSGFRPPVLPTNFFSTTFPPLLVTSHAVPEGIGAHSSTRPQSPSTLNPIPPIPSLPSGKRQRQRLLPLTCTVPIPKRLTRAHC